LHNEGHTPQRGLLLFLLETSVTKQQFGDIDFWDEKGFGFIRQPGGGRIFFSIHYVEPDWKGSKAWCFSRGIPVKFEVSQKILGGETKTFAANVVPIFEMSEPENIRGYRETSEVLNLNRRKGFGFLRRPCGDSLFFHRKAVTPGFDDRWDFLEVGSPIWHGINFDGSSGLWSAIDLELYSYQELESFKHENDPVAAAVTVPEPEPAPAPEPTVAALEFTSVLAPATFGLSLIEIIKRRKLKAV
jgi:cold shock CspA family protein